MPDETFFNDDHFKDTLVALLCRDQKSLNDCAYLLSSDDFKPLRAAKQGTARWAVAGMALDHYRKYHEPVGKLLNATVLEYAENLNLNPLHLRELQEYCSGLQRIKLSAPEAITSKVIKYKQEIRMARVLQEASELSNNGRLTPEKLREMVNDIPAHENGIPVATDYLETLHERLERRRSLNNRIRRPWTFIEPLDSMIEGLGPKELGLIIAPYKRGKSLMLQWLAVAYVMQQYNVLYLTLENPKSSVEDRLDSIVTAIPIKILSRYPMTLSQRFARFKGMVDRGLKIIDGTQGGISIQQMEQIIMAERDRGFFTDALIIDYDDEIVPPVKQKERRFEFSDIYRELRQMTARLNLITWTAAQTKRGTEHLKIISGDQAAEDISKLRKVSLAISMGKGDWEDGDSIYLWVAAANNDAQHIGCHIIPDRDRMLVYDREATALAAKRNNPQSPQITPGDDE